MQRRIQTACTLEQLEPRLALAVSVVETETIDERGFLPDLLSEKNFIERQPGILTVASDEGDNVYLQQIEMTPTELLVADNGSFLDYMAVEAFEERFDEFIVTNGAEHKYEDAVTANTWWLFPTPAPEGGPPPAEDLTSTENLTTTRLALRRPKINIGPYNGRQSDFFGELYYKQSDGVLSTWTYSAWKGGTDYANVQAAGSLKEPFRVTSGPGFGGGPISYANTIVASEEPLPAGYVFPKNVWFRSEQLPENQQLYRGEAKTYGGVRHYLEVEWSQVPVAPPLMTANYFGINYTKRIVGNNSEEVIPITSSVIDPFWGEGDERSEYQTTLGIAMRTNGLRVNIPRAITEGSPDEAPSFGIIPGTLTGSLVIGGDGQQHVYKVPFSDRKDGATGLEKSQFRLFFDERNPLLDVKRKFGIIEEEFATNVVQDIDYLFEELAQATYTYLEGRIEDGSDLVFEIGSHIDPIDTDGIRNELNNLYEDNAENTALRALNGINVEISLANVEDGTAIDAVRVADLDYHVYVKPTIANSVYFVAGADITRSVTVDLLKEGSSIYVNSPIRVAEVLDGDGPNAEPLEEQPDIDFRATNIIVNAPLESPDYIITGRSRSESSPRLPRLTEPEGGELTTPTFTGTHLATESHTQIVSPTPVIEGTEIKELLVLPGREGYGYDPANSPKVNIDFAPTELAEVSVKTVSGGVGEMILLATGADYKGIPIGADPEVLPPGYTTADPDDPNVEPGSQYLELYFDEPELRTVESINRWEWINNDASGIEEPVDPPEGYTAPPVIAISPPEIVADPTRVGYGVGAKVTPDNQVGNGIRGTTADVGRTMELSHPGLYYPGPGGLGSYKAYLKSKDPSRPFWDPLIPVEYRSEPEFEIDWNENLTPVFGGGNNPQIVSYTYRSLQVKGVRVKPGGSGFGLNAKNATELVENYVVVITGNGDRDNRNGDDPAADGYRTVDPNPSPQNNTWREWQGKYVEAPNSYNGTWLYEGKPVNIPTVDGPVIDPTAENPTFYQIPVIGGQPAEYRTTRNGEEVEQWEHAEIELPLTADNVAKYERFLLGGTLAWRGASANDQVNEEFSMETRFFNVGGERTDWLTKNPEGLLAPVDQLENIGKNYQFSPDVQFIGRLTSDVAKEYGTDEDFDGSTGVTTDAGGNKTRDGDVVISRYKDLVPAGSPFANAKEGASIYKASVRNVVAYADSTDRPEFVQSKGKFRDIDYLELLNDRNDDTTPISAWGSVDNERWFRLQPYRTDSVLNFYWPATWVAGEFELILGVNEFFEPFQEWQRLEKGMQIEIEGQQFELIQWFESSSKLTLVEIDPVTKERLPPERREGLPTGGSQGKDIRFGPDTVYVDEQTQQFSYTQWIYDDQDEVESGHRSFDSEVLQLVVDPNEIQGQLSEIAYVKLFFDKEFETMQIEEQLLAFATMGTDPARGRAVVSAGGEITNLQVTYYGSGYITAPTVYLPHPLDPDPDDPDPDDPGDDENWDEDGTKQAAALAVVSGGIYELNIDTAGFNYYGTTRPGFGSDVLLGTEIPVFNEENLPQGASNPKANFISRNSAVTGGQVVDPGTGLKIVRNELQGFQTGDIELEPGLAPGQEVAVFEAIVEPDGQITRFRRISGGSGYQASPVVTIDAPVAPSAAVAVAHLDSQLGRVSFIEVIDKGHRYDVAPKVFIYPPNPRGEGRAATGVAVLGPSGEVIRIEVTDPGRGYTSPPIVEVQEVDASNLAEYIDIAANIEAAQYEIYVSRNTWTPREKGLLRVRTQQALANGPELDGNGELVVGGVGENVWEAAEWIYVEAAAADLLFEGDVDAKAFTVLMNSYERERAFGPYSFTTISSATNESSGTIYAERFVANLGNDTTTPLAGGSIANTVDLDLAVDNLRVTAAESATSPQGAFPYDITIRESVGRTPDGEIDPSQIRALQDGEVLIEAVARSGGAITLDIPVLKVGASLLTDGDLNIITDDYSQTTPLESVYGAIKVVARKNIAIKNSVLVEAAKLDEDVNDIFLFAQNGNVTLEGLVKSPNGVYLRQNKELTEEERQAILADGALTAEEKREIYGFLGGNAKVYAPRLRAQSIGDIVLHTNVDDFHADVDYGSLTVTEEDDVNMTHLQVPNGPIRVTAEGVDRGSRGVNPIALTAKITAGDELVASAPKGSIDVFVNTSGDLSLGEIDGLSVMVGSGDEIALQEAAMFAAGSVRIINASGDVTVLDAPTAGQTAVQVKAASTKQLSEVLGSGYGYTYEGNFPGEFPSTLSGRGALPLVDLFEGVSEGELEVGDYVLIKNQVDNQRTDARDETRENGVYRIERLGGGHYGFADWLLRRAEFADDRNDFEAGSFVRVAMGRHAGEVYQLFHAEMPDLTVMRTVNNQLVVAGGVGDLLSVDVNDVVEGEGILPGARVTSVDYQNGLVSLGVGNSNAIFYERIDTDRNEVTFKFTEDAPYLFEHLNRVVATDYLFEQVDRGTDSDRQEAFITGEWFKVGAKIVSADSLTKTFRVPVDSLLVPRDRLVALEEGEDENDPERRSNVIIGFAETTSGRIGLNPAVRSFLMNVVEDDVALDARVTSWPIVKRSDSGGVIIPGYNYKTTDGDIATGTFGFTSIMVDEEALGGWPIKFGDDVLYRIKDGLKVRDYINAVVEITYGSDSFDDTVPVGKVRIDFSREVRVRIDGESDPVFYFRDRNRIVPADDQSDIDVIQGLELSVTDGSGVSFNGEAVASWDSGNFKLTHEVNRGDASDETTDESGYAHRGSGYGLEGDTIPVTFSLPDSPLGRRATGYAVVDASGGIGEIVVQDQGVGYRTTSDDRVRATLGRLPHAGGSPAGEKKDGVFEMFWDPITLRSIGVSGLIETNDWEATKAVATATVIDSGLGYTANETAIIDVEFSLPDENLVGATPLKGYAVPNGFGGIRSVIITEGGIGYTDRPEVTIAPPLDSNGVPVVGGKTAVASVDLIYEIEIPTFEYSNGWGYTTDMSQEIGVTFAPPGFVSSYEVYPDDWEEVELRGQIRKEFLRDPVTGEKLEDPITGEFLEEPIASAVTPYPLGRAMEGYAVPDGKGGVEKIVITDPGAGYTSPPAIISFNEAPVKEVEGFVLLDEGWQVNSSEQVENPTTVWGILADEYVFSNDLKQSVSDIQVYAGENIYKLRADLVPRTATEGSIYYTYPGNEGLWRNYQEDFRRTIVVNMESESPADQVFVEAIVVENVVVAVGTSSQGGDYKIRAADTSQIHLGMLVSVAGSQEDVDGVPEGTTVVAINDSTGELTFSEKVIVAEGAVLDFELRREEADLLVQFQDGEQFATPIVGRSFLPTGAVDGQTVIDVSDVGPIKVGMVLVGDGVPPSSIVTAVDVENSTITVSRTVSPASAPAELTFAVQVPHVRELMSKTTEVKKYEDLEQEMHSENPFWKVVDEMHLDSSLWEISLEDEILISDGESQVQLSGRIRQTVFSDQESVDGGFPLEISRAVVPDGLAAEMMLAAHCYEFPDTEECLENGAGNRATTLILTDNRVGDKKTTGEAVITGMTLELDGTYTIKFALKPQTFSPESSLDFGLDGDTSSHVSIQFQVKDVYKKRFKVAGKAATARAKLEKRSTENGTRTLDIQSGSTGRGYTEWKDTKIGVRFSEPNEAGGIQMEGYAKPDGKGGIERIVVTRQGTGYTTNPTVEVDFPVPDGGSFDRTPFRAQFTVSLNPSDLAKDAFSFTGHKDPVKAVVGMGNPDVDLAEEWKKGSNGDQLEDSDGVELVAGDRVLVVGQDDAWLNGIWLVVADGPWTRPPDYDNPNGDGGEPVLAGTHVLVERGVLFRGATFIIDGEGAFEVYDPAGQDGDEVFWSLFGGSSEIEVDVSNEITEENNRVFLGAYFANYDGLAPGQLVFGDGVKPGTVITKVYPGLKAIEVTPGGLPVEVSVSGSFDVVGPASFELSQVPSDVHSEGFDKFLTMPERFNEFHDINIGQRFTVTTTDGFLIENGTVTGIDTDYRRIGVEYDSTAYRIISPEYVDEEISQEGSKVGRKLRAEVPNSWIDSITPGLDAGYKLEVGYKLVRPDGNALPFDWKSQEPKKVSEGEEFSIYEIDAPVTDYVVRDLTLRARVELQADGEANAGDSEVMSVLSVTFQTLSKIDFGMITSTGSGRAQFSVPAFGFAPITADNPYLASGDAVRFDEPNGSPLDVLRLVEIDKEDKLLPGNYVTGSGLNPGLRIKSFDGRHLKFYSAALLEEPEAVGSGWGYKVDDDFEKIVSVKTGVPVIANGSVVHVDQEAVTVVDVDVETGVVVLSHQLADNLFSHEEVANGAKVACVVFGQAFTDKLLANFDAKTSLLVHDKLPEVRTTIATDNIVDTVRYYVATDGGTSRSAGSLARILSAAQENSYHFSEDHPRFEEGSDWGGAGKQPMVRFTSAVTSIELGEPLPPIRTNSLSLDGRYYVGSTPQRVGVNGRFITQTAEGGAVRSSSVIDGIVVEEKRQSGSGEIFKNASGTVVKNMRLGGFQNGAAVRIDGVDDVLLSNSVIGRTAEGIQASSRFGVYVTGTSERTTVLSNEIVSAEQAGVRVDADAKDTKLVGVTLGRDYGDSFTPDVFFNETGVEAVADSVQLGIDSVAWKILDEEGEGTPKTYSASMLVGSKDIVVDVPSDRLALLEEGLAVVGLGLPASTLIENVDLLNNRLRLSNAATRTVSTQVLIGHQAIAKVNGLEATLHRSVNPESIYPGQRVSFVTGTSASRVFTTTITSIEKVAVSDEYPIRLRLAQAQPLLGMYEEGIRLVEFGDPPSNSVQYNRNGVVIGLFGEVSANGQDLKLNMSQNFTGWASLREGMDFQVRTSADGLDPPTFLTGTIKAFDEATREIEFETVDTLTSFVLRPIVFDAADGFQMVNTTVSDSIKNGVVLGGGKDHRIGGRSVELAVRSTLAEAEADYPDGTDAVELVSYRVTASVDGSGILRFSNAKAAAWLAEQVDLDGNPRNGSVINLYGTNLPTGSRVGSFDVSTGIVTVEVYIDGQQVQTPNFQFTSSATVYFGLGAFAGVGTANVRIGDKVDGFGIYEFTEVEAFRKPVDLGAGSSPPRGYLALSTPKDFLEGNLPVAGDKLRLVNPSTLANVITNNSGYGITLVDTNPFDTLRSLGAGIAGNLDETLYRRAYQSWEIVGNYIDVSYDVAASRWFSSPNFTGPVHPLLFARLFGDDDGQESSYDRTDVFGNQYGLVREPVQDGGVIDDPFGEGSDGSDGGSVGDDGGGDDTGGVVPGSPF